MSKSSDPTLVIADNVKLPLRAVTETIAIVAKKGSGKSYGAMVLAEEMLEQNQTIIAMDPTGAWFGLRSSSSGKKEGYPVVVAGGDHADIPLLPTSGEHLAAAVVANRFSLILDFTGLRKGEKHRIATDFMETLYRINRQPLHLFVDEADDFMPQKPFGNEAVMLGAGEDIVKRGRKRGIGCTLITQRPADIAKNVLTQCEVLISLCLNHPKDIQPIQDWVLTYSDKKDVEKMVSALPSLQQGEAYIWSPSWLKIFHRMKFRKRRTFDSSATPEVGHVVAAPQKLAQVDADKLTKELLDMAEEVKANDPKKLKAELQKTKQQLAEANQQLADRPPETVTVEVPVFDEHMKQELTTALDRANSVGEELRQLYQALHGMVPAPQHPQPRRPEPNLNKLLHMPTVIPTPKDAKPTKTASTEPAEEGEVKRSKGLMRLLMAIAQFPSQTRDQLAIRANLALSGTFSGYMATLLKAGYICAVGVGEKTYTVTREGLDWLGTDFTPMPTGVKLREHWQKKLGERSGIGRIFKYLTDTYPDSISRKDLAPAVQLEISGTYAGYITKLTKLNLAVVNQDRSLSASPTLFD